MTTGDKLGPYEITALLCKGGVGARAPNARVARALNLTKGKFT